MTTNEGKTNARYAVVNARSALRSAKDDYDAALAYAEHRAIQAAGGDPKALGSNEQLRKMSLAIALDRDDAYQTALDRLRTAERDADLAEAELMAFEDEDRARKLDVYAFLAQALLGQPERERIDRAADASIGTLLDRAFRPE